MYIRGFQLLTPQRRVRWAGAAGDTPVGFIHCLVRGGYMYYLSKTETNILFVPRYSINLVNGVNWVIPIKTSFITSSKSLICPPKPCVKVIK